MNHIVDSEPHEFSRALTGAHDKTFSPTPREDQSLQQNLDDLRKKEKGLAEDYGISSEGIDSVAVLQEARERTQSRWKRFGLAIQDFLLNTNTSVLNSAAAADMHRLYHLRLEDARIRRSSANPTSSVHPFIQGAPHCVDASRFWAVLIGIDAYESSPLNGCVSDASLMKELLIDDLGVPKKRVQCLLGSHDPIPDDHLTPSRANIVNTLHSLIHNDEIQHGDNIIIYYAGHGSSYRCSKYSPMEPECSTDLCPVEALCPIDRDTLDSQRQWVPDISDRELNALLKEISRVKGHRVTFFADCCHASGMNRNLDTGIRERSISISSHTNVDDMLRAADERLKGFPYYRSVLSKDWKPDMGSHVILAACREYQSA
ncbi:caspase domain-containing protein, partial [Armillaria mellea]